MNKEFLDKRSAQRDLLIKQAKDSNVNRIADLFLGAFRHELEHLGKGDQVPTSIPVGKDRFTDWLKDVITEYFPTLLGILENTRTLKDYATQVADAVAKSNTSVQNPMKDYPMSKDPIFVKAQDRGRVVGPAQMTPAKPKVENIYGPTTEQFRCDPENPGVQLRRVKDKLYQSPISGSFYQFGPWKDAYDYRGAREVKFETGAHNQTHPFWNEMHPIKPFLSGPVESGDQVGDVKPEGKGEYSYDREDLYNVFKDKNQDLIDPPAPNKEEKAPVGTRKASKDPLDKLTRKAQFFAPTTVPTRQCPDHPGQQTARLEDGVRQCLLDNKIYNFVTGFVTEDGVKHSGGSVTNQHSIPPGSIVVRLDKKASLEKHGMGGLGESPKVHSFLYNALQYLPADSQERRILNYKFSNNLTLDEAMARIEEADRLSVQQVTEPQQTQMKKVR